MSHLFETRARVHEELQAIGELAEPALRQTHEGKPSLEVSKRAEQLLARLELRCPPRIVAVRAETVLQRVGATMPASCSRSGQRAHLTRG